MNETAPMGHTSKILIYTAAFVVVTAGMKTAQPILVPFLLSVFVAIISSPLLFWLRRKGLPTELSLALVILGILVIGLLIGLLVGSSLSDFSKSLPTFQESLRAKTIGLAGLLKKAGINFSENQLLEYVDPGAAMRLASTLLTGLGNVLSNAFLIFLTVIFILLEAASFPSKLNAAFGASGISMTNYEDFTKKINQYMVIKSWLSLGTGVLVTVWLAILGVNYPVLWGLLAFLFNYVPNIGSIIAAVPAILLAYIQIGSTTALLAAAGYIVFNIVVGNVIEPRFMGRGLGLSTLIVFLSLVFWGWILGPVGMLLSIPLTMTIKIALSSNEETKWISTLLGPSVQHEETVNHDSS